MMYSLWLYRFKPGLTAPTLAQLRGRGAEKVHPGCTWDDGTFLGRLHGHANFTHATVFRREGLAAVRAEAEDVDNLLRNLRILSPAVAAMEARDYIERDDPELVELGDDEWHQRAVRPFIDAANANAEVAYHLNVIGLSCMKHNTVPPYTIQSVWRDKLKQPQTWIGGTDPRIYISAGVHQ